MSATINYAQYPTLDNVVNSLTALKMNVTQDVMDRISLSLAAVISEVEQSTSRKFIADVTDTSKTYDGTGTSEIEVDEMVSLTGVQVVGYSTPYSMSGVVLVSEQSRPKTRIVVNVTSLPAINTLGNLPFSAIFPTGRQNVIVTGRFGYGSTVPADLWQAIADETALRIFNERNLATSNGLKSVTYGDVRKEWRDTEKNQKNSFDEVVLRYKRPIGRKLRKLRNPMI